jgi:hypothetical protein
MMSADFLGRRAFVRLCSACAAFLTQAANKQARTAPAPQANRTAVRNRKNFVAIQVKPYAWVDEGIERLSTTSRARSIRSGATPTITPKRE